LLNQFLTRDYGVAVRVPTAFHLESNMYGCCKCFQCNSISGLINVLPFVCFDLTLFGSFSLKWEVELICIFLLGSYYYRLRNRAARGVALSTEWPPPPCGWFRLLHMPLYSLGSLRILRIFWSRWFSLNCNLRAALSVRRTRDASSSLHTQK
jgi:hypothetical protein